MSDRTTKYSTNEDLYLRVKDDHNLRRRQVALRLRELWSTCLWHSLFMILT